MAQEERRSSQKLLRLTLDYKCKVEEIARRQPVTTVVHLLGDDFGRSLYFHRSTGECQIFCVQGS